MTLALIRWTNRTNILEIREIFIHLTIANHPLFVIFVGFVVSQNMKFHDISPYKIHRRPGTKDPCVAHCYQPKEIMAAVTLGVPIPLFLHKTTAL